VRRRAVLVTLGSVTLAGCGWSQEQENSGPAGSGNDGTPTPVELAESEGGEGPIEADAEELLLAPDAIGSEWEEIDVQRTGTCNAFERSGEGYTFTLETCAEVYDDEETATEEYEGEVDTSSKVMSEQPDLEPEIGDQAAVFQGQEFREQTFRVRFRDTNATGMVDLTVETPFSDDQSGESEGPELDASDAVDWAATMHGNWRS
jgi:hypothetical protein